MKVFVTPAGFHDAYVAAPSRKAALAAWGSDADLFARGVAAEVTDPALMKAPLARPGEIVRRSRGTAAEELAAALPPIRRTKPAAKAKRSGTPRPKPDRAALDAAEAAVERLADHHRAAMRDLKERQTAIDREKRALAKEQAEVEAARDEAAAVYDAALRKWRG